MLPPNIAPYLFDIRGLAIYFAKEKVLINEARLKVTESVQKGGTFLYPFYTRKTTKNNKDIKYQSYKNIISPIEHGRNGEFM